MQHEDAKRPNWLSIALSVRNLRLTILHQMKSDVNGKLNQINAKTKNETVSRQATARAYLVFIDLLIVSAWSNQIFTTSPSAGCNIYKCSTLASLRHP